MQAYYLKYRPQRFADLDNERVRSLLTKIFKSQRVPHAFLFTGPRGAGKTSAARIIAKSLNCLHPQDGFEPCNQCSVCRSIDRGSFLDVLEIDAASNRGIDDIRSLKEKVKLAATQGNFKVFIIDEVHMLTTEAFNALLKTLEEPPEKVVFILCTTNPEKLPPTIVSRCVRVNFGQASDKEIARSLNKVIKGEGLILEKGVLEKIVSLAEGSFRDAQKILEELSLDSKKITLAAVDKISGHQQGVSAQKLVSIWEGGGTLAEAIEEVHRVMDNGGDVFVYIKDILARLRVCLHYFWGLPDGKKNSFQEEDLLKKVAIFSRAFQEAKNSPLPWLSLEVALREAMGEKEKSVSSPRKKKEEDPVLSSSIKKGSIRKTKKADKSEASSAEKKKTAVKLGEKEWAAILTKVKPKNHSVEAFLKAAYPLKLEGDELILGVYYSFHKECLERESSRRIVESAAADVLGRKVRVFYELKGRKKKPQPSSYSLPEKDSDDLMSLAENIFGGEENV